MADVEKSVNEIINDLKNKINNISSLGQNADKDKIAKVNDIKQKAIAVLTQVSNKIGDTLNSATNNEDLESAIEVIKIRSNKLYEDAVNKIDNIMRENVTQEVSDIVEDVKKDIDEFFEKEEIKNVAHSAKDVTVEVADKAVKCLKDWLKPEEK